MEPEKILVVTLEQPMRETLVSILQSAGYAVSQAASGQEALEMLGSGQYQLLLVTIPELDGFALLERSKQLDADRPVVICISANEIPAALTAIRNGAYDCLLKPFERCELLAGVQRAFEFRRLKLENKVYQSNLESLVAARTHQLTQTTTDLERTYDIALELAADLLDLKHAESEFQNRYVTSFTIALARAMGLSGGKIREIARGAFLHDLGLIAIPDAILRKPSALLPVESEIFQQHCVRGYRVLKKIPFLAEAAEIVYAHEEHFDGSGYPRGLKGEEIPLGARMVAVTHFLDELTAKPGSGPALSWADIRRKIESESGKRFDPGVVRVLMSMPETIWQDLRAQIDSQIRPS